MVAAILNNTQQPDHIFVLYSYLTEFVHMASKEPF